MFGFDLKNNTDNKKRYEIETTQASKEAEQRLEWIKKYTRQVPKKTPLTPEEGNSNESNTSSGGSSSGVIGSFDPNSPLTGDKIVQAALKIQREHPDVYYTQEGSRRDIINKNSGDCSTFTKQSIQLAGGPDIGGYSGAQAKFQPSQWISNEADFMPGDVTFMGNQKGDSWKVQLPNGKTVYIGHVGIYVGGGEHVHFPSNKYKILKSKLTWDKSKSCVGAMRVAPATASSGGSSSPSKKEKQAIYSINQVEKQARKEGSVAPEEHYSKRAVILVEKPTFTGGRMMLAKYERKDYALELSELAKQQSFSDMRKLDESKYLKANKTVLLRVDKAMDDLLRNVYPILQANGLYDEKIPVLESLSPSQHDSMHGWGGAIKLPIYGLEHGVKVADVFYSFGVRAIAIGGAIEEGRGFIHADIGPAYSWSYGHGRYVGLGTFISD